MTRSRPQNLSRRQVLAGTAAMAASALFPHIASAQSTRPAIARRPNLLMYFPDQMRRHAMGFTGQDPVHTPNFDRFASEGFYLSHATSTFPLCTPWRGMMMTSRFPHETGLINNTNSSRPNVFLRRDERCLTDVLHAQEYHVGYIGKWHLTAAHQPYLPDISHNDGLAWDEFTPPEERHSIDYWYAYNAYDDHLRPRYWTGNAGRNDFRYVDEWSPQHEADQIIRYLKNADRKMRDPDKPFALIASMNPPHPPYSEVPDRLLQKYGNKTSIDLLNRPNVKTEGAGAAAKVAGKQYFSAITGVDEQFGRVLDALKDLNLEQDTLVMMTCDHGDMMGSHGLMGKPYPYEEAFNIPMIFRWPGKIAAGKSDDLLIGTTDIMPTLLNLLGSGSAVPTQARGTDYSNIILSRGSTDRPATALYIDSTKGGHRGVRNLTHTLILGKTTLATATDTAIRLFNNVKDPYQMNNLATTEPALVAELTKQTYQWLEKINDPWRPET